MSIKMTWVITYKNDAREMKRGFKAALREALKKGGEFWIKKKLPGHFSHPAAQLYGYEERNPKYIRRKKGRPPLFFTGTTKKRVMSSAVARGSPGGKKAGARITVRMNVYEYIKRPGRPDRDKPDLGAEITTLTSREVKQMADIVEKELVKRLDKKKGRKPRKRKVRIAA